MRHAVSSVFGRRDRNAALCWTQASRESRTRIFEPPAAAAGEVAEPPARSRYAPPLPSSQAEEGGGAGGVDPLGGTGGVPVRWPIFAPPLPGGADNFCTCNISPGR